MYKRQVLCQKVAVKEFFPRGAITRNNQQTNEVVSVYGTKAANFHQGEEKFLQEARTLAQFNNVAGVVRVQDFFRENGTAYIVMEYLEGITLKQYLQTYGPVSYTHLDVYKRQQTHIASVSVIESVLSIMRKIRKRWRWLCGKLYRQKKEAIFATV